MVLGWVGVKVGLVWSWVGVGLESDEVGVVMNWNWEGRG